MHTVWKGAISFGLVHVPVKMFTATEDKDIHLRMIHRECGTPISNVRSCLHCDRKVEWEEITKGFEYEKGRFVLFEEEELEAAKPESTRTIQILDFVSLEEIDPLYYQKTYYLSPDQAGGGAYGLLLEAMRQSGRIGIAKVSIRSKSSLAAIRAVENCICMETMFYPDEIRPIQNVPNLPGAEVQVNDRELAMAKLLIDQLSTPFDPAKYTDDYRVALLNAIERKIAGEGIDVVTAPAAERTNVIDLMAALQASLEAVKPGAGAAAAGAAAGADAEAAPAAGRANRSGRARTAAKTAAPEAAAEDAGAAKTGESSRKKPTARASAKKAAAGAESVGAGSAAGKGTAAPKRRTARSPEGAGGPGQ
ncbi:Ku protein [Cohnella thailandensis]|uniref:Non-homologous end joining protein Ku n=1 Tax=Cohnella thailandensis TaxID=557557 RepID=A0A841SU68_9BACL|nr:Ku protein [Cohnella thailandensis]MBB6633440.1 Ku protein [Cohnella thailandensis]MBP1974455.1 DNA end-binding protein Ku [Cohnella thailandensis]